MSISLAIVVQTQSFWGRLASLFAGPVRASSSPPEQEAVTPAIDPRIAQAGVIVCRHVAVDGAPILQAFRDEPADPGDSGWQVLCASGKEEKFSEVEIWSVSNVVTREPSLAPFMSLKAGTALTRVDAKSPWQVSE